MHGLNFDGFDARREVRVVEWTVRVVRRSAVARRTKVCRRKSAFEDVRTLSSIDKLARMLVLSEHDVRLLLSMDDLIDAMHGALSEFASGRVQQPLRTVLEVGPQHAFFGVMPAFLPNP